MDKPACEECMAIVREVREAYRETWLSAGPEFRDAWRATYKLIGGTEEDVLRAGELLPNAATGSSPRIGNAIRRMLAHEARASHRLRDRHEPAGR